MISLQKPCRRYRHSFLEANEEFADRGEVEQIESDSFEQVLRRCQAEACGLVTEGRVPQTTFWMVASEDFVGRISIRHHLNPSLVKFGGHIGYAVRPSARRRGIGKRALRLCLAEAKRLGLLRVLLTCDDDNEGSIRIIEACGGVLLDKVDNGRASLTRRYWIDLV